MARFASVGPSVGADYSKSLENALEKQKFEIEERLSIEDSGSVNFV